MPLFLVGANCKLKRHIYVVINGKMSFLYFLGFPSFMKRGKLHWEIWKGGHCFLRTVCACTEQKRKNIIYDMTEKHIDDRIFFERGGISSSCYSENH